MKSYFIKMFKYSHFANCALLKAITDAGNPRGPIKLMSHLLAAERRWLDRVNDVEPYPNAELWPKEYTIEHCTHLVNEYNEEWLGFLERVTEEDLNKVIIYQNALGNNQTSVSDILTHVINHGTHTRAQAGQQLKLSGTETLPITDYVYYLRQLNS
ncbi:DinB family protein [Mucilaginibacter sp. AW1-7]|uniref:DinB family protein n=1 Tax=Mucilaginibacter sp. AW1-7 TaxID=3349874 RepID=UPI003F73B75F